MGALHFFKLSSDVLEKNFDCGNCSINNRIYNSYYASLLRQIYCYQIKYKDFVIGYYGIYFFNMDTNAMPQYMQEYDACYVPFYTTIKIDFIAIDKKYQGQNLGTTALKIIISSLKVLSGQYPIRMIILDALKEKIQWYKHIGFKIINQPSNPDSATIPMYLDCIDDYSLIEQYSELV